MLSIIMPVKNTEAFLKPCLDSIVKQRLQDWELMAVNDHSVDSSRDILLAYAQQDSRIRVMENEGVGVTAALQTGYKHSVGKYITRMDSDDINELHKYEYMLNQLKEKGPGYLALGQVQYFCEAGLGDGFQNYERWMNVLISNGNCFEEVYKECVIPSPCWMLHQEDFDRVGAFDTTMYPEDYDLCFRMYQHGLIPIACQEVLFHWRDYPHRTTRQVAHYQGDAILALKCHHFLQIDWDSDKNLVVWGAGKRGKFIAHYLVSKQIPFDWVCNNKNKIDHDIYGIRLKSEKSLGEIHNKQIMVSVANADEQRTIKELCARNDWDAYFFC
ncbi:MAG: glycosyltransferase family 2 protein [Bacteroidetes bacterium]|nr:glycosyltransferase family 2 protein [Bacteroidota bacterium]